MARSITFTLDGPVDSLISITELSDGTLRFDVEILGSGSVRDLRGLFFDLGDIDASTVDLKVTGINGSEAYVGRTSFDEAAVSKVKGDVNVKGKVAKAQPAVPAPTPLIKVRRSNFMVYLPTDNSVKEVSRVGIEG